MTKGNFTGLWMRPRRRYLNAIYVLEHFLLPSEKWVVFFFLESPDDDANGDRPCIWKVSFILLISIQVVGRRIICPLE